MKSYKLSPDMVNQENKDISKKRVIGLFFWPMLFSCIAIYKYISLNGNVTYQEVKPLITAITVFLLFAIFMSFEGSKQYKRILDSLQIIIDGDFIIRKTYGFRDIVINKKEIVNYREVKGKKLIVRHKNTFEKISIPSRMDGYDEIKETLKQWEISEVSKSTISENDIKQLGVVILYFVLAFGLMVSKNLTIIIMSGIISISVLIYVAFKYKINKYTGARGFLFYLMYILFATFVLFEIINKVLSLQ